MKNRDGSISNGYFGSYNHVEDERIRDNGHLADALAWDLGLWIYTIHRIISNIRTFFLKIRRYYMELRK